MKNKQYSNSIGKNKLISNIKENTNLNKFDKNNNFKCNNFTNPSNQKNKILKINYSTPKNMKGVYDRKTIDNTYDYNFMNPNQNNIGLDMLFNVNDDFKTLIFKNNKLRELIITANETIVRLVNFKFNQKGKL